MKKNALILMVFSLLATLIACPGCGGGSSDSTVSNPSNVQVIPGDGSVTLTWNPASGATTYNIYFAQQPGVTKDNYQTLSGGRKLSELSSPAIVGSLTNGSTYYFIVTAVTKTPSSTKESSGSPEYSATPLPSPPAAPQNLQAQPGNKQVTLSWNTVLGADTYNIYYATLPGVTKYNSIKSSNRNSPAIISDLNNGQRYYFIVTSFNSTYSIEGNSSGEVSATPLGLPGDTMPLTGNATSITATSANLPGSFTNPPGDTTTAWFEYGLTTSYGNTTTSDAYLQSGSINFSKAVTSLSPMTTVHFRLVTQNSGGIFYGQDQQFMTAANPATVLLDLDAPGGLLYDGTYIYWMEMYSGRVRRLDVATDIESTIATNMSFGGNSGSIAIDGTYIYLTDGYSAIRRMNLDGSNLQNNFSTVAKSPTNIIAHSSGLYVREEECEAANMLLHQYISRISLDGQTRTQLFERPGNSPGGCGGSGFGGSMAIDNSYIYWTDYYLGTIQRLPLSGGAPVIVATSILYPDQLLLDDTNLYVSHSGGISKIDLSSGTMTSASATPGAMVKDGGYIYILAPTQIKKLDLSNGSTTTVTIADQGNISIPVATSSHLYWITGGNHYYPPLGTLKQIIKP